ncbi:MAG: DUF177 domain-containing protein [Candidatus Omnitrophica bacterium]|nr:DUF177 domain-containing protein [Candidatus Omnitrophota bacterium]
MKIHPNRIPSEGVREDAVYDPKALDLDRPDVQVLPPINVSAMIALADRELVVDAAIQGRLKLICSKCLSEFERELRTNAILTYPVSATDVVDVTEDIRQEIMLAYPMIPVCQDGCRGLCGTCGQNLNLKACPHTPSVPEHSGR